MTDYIKAIEDSNWAIRTKKNRISYLNTLKRNIDPDSNNYNFIKKFNLVSKYILDTITNPATRKTKILEIKAILKLVNDKAADKYESLVHTLIDDSNEYRGNNVAKAENKTVTINELINVPNIIANDIIYVYDDLFLSNDKIDKLRSINAKYKYLRSLTEYIITVLYTYQPPVRADYATVQFKPSKTANWYDMNKGIIHWQDFKNVKSFGSRSFKLESNVKDILNDYISILNYIIDNPKKLLYLVGSKDYREFTRESFSVYFIRIFDKYINKKISINDIRHAYELAIITDPDYNNLTLNDKKNLHDRLLHTSSTAQQYLTVKNPISLEKFTKNL